MSFVLKENPTGKLKLVNGILYQEWLLYCQRELNHKMTKAGSGEYWKMVWRSVPEMGE